MKMALTLLADTLAVSALAGAFFGATGRMSARVEETGI